MGVICEFGFGSLVIYPALQVVNTGVSCARPIFFQFSFTNVLDINLPFVFGKSATYNTRKFAGCATLLFMSFNYIFSYLSIIHCDSSNLLH